MEHMIHQLVMNFTGKILEETGDFTRSGIGEATNRMFELCKEHAVAISVVALDQMDEALRAEKTQRKVDGLVVHESKVPRSLLTAIGPLSYTRTCFKDTGTGKTTYLLDHIVRVRKYERVCASLSAKLVNEASEMSYEKSSLAVTGGAVSRQTVRNKAMRTEELAFVPQRKEKPPEILHIFADEDHVAMQDGRSQNVNLMTVTEGSGKVCKGRNKLIDPMHVQGYKIKSEDHWDYVAALCERKYDMSKVKRVFIHGDGAEWIKGGTDHFMNAEHVLDGYHLNAQMRRLTSGPVCNQYRSLLWQAINSNVCLEFRTLVHEMVEEMEQLNAEGILTKKTESVRKAGAYILSNWKAIMLRKDPDMQGSCTEAMVSHVLSERLSRNPMGWSEEGLSQMSMIRVFTANGERVREEHIRSCPRCEGKKAPHYIKKYRDIVNRQEKEVLSERRDWTIFEKPSYTLGLVTGTKRAYDALSKTRYVN
jgi:hypothetical protein